MTSVLIVDDELFIVEFFIYYCPYHGEEKSRVCTWIYRDVDVSLRRCLSKSGIDDN